MKKLNVCLALIFSVLAIFSCKDEIQERGTSPVVSENCQGVFFPKTNATSFEIDPADPTEITITIARTDTVNAFEVPIIVDVNDKNVCVVPQKVTFAAKEKTTQFVVTFPTAEVGVTYNLSLSVSGAEIVNPYIDGFPSLNTNVTRVKWNEIDSKIVMVNPFWSGGHHYVSKAEITTYGAGEIVNGIRLTDPFIAAEGEDAEPDENGIFNGVLDIWPEETVRDNVQWIITIDKNDSTVIKRAGIGAMWYDVEMEIVTLKKGTAVRDEEDNIVKIVFPAKSLFIIANSANQGWTSGGDMIIYLSWDVYLADNMKIKDFNDVEFEKIEGAVGEFESLAFSESWGQYIAKAIDIDEENEDSEYKNLYYLPDLYANGFGVAFYYNGKVINIPANQPTGIKLELGGKQFMVKDIFVSSSDLIESGMVTSSKGVDVYTLGLKFHFEDGTVLGEFAETFYYSEDPIEYDIEDFCGNFILSGTSLYSSYGYPDAKMSVTIEEGDDENTLIITGIDLAESLIATFDPVNSCMSIEPQELEDFYDDYYEETVTNVFFLSVLSDFDMSDTDALTFAINLKGKLTLTSSSDVIGYLIIGDDESGETWDYDGYYDLVFTPQSAATHSLSRKSATTQQKVKDKTKKLDKVLIHRKEKCSKNNFSIQPKVSRKGALKDLNAVPIL